MTIQQLIDHLLHAPGHPTIPEQVEPGQRFARSILPGRKDRQGLPSCALWDCYDWLQLACRCCESDLALFETCSRCKGTGYEPDSLQPVPFAHDLDEKDARLLVYGEEMLAACCAVRSWGCPGTTEEGIDVPYLVDEAIRKVRGEERK